MLVSPELSQRVDQLLFDAQKDLEKTTKALDKQIVQGAPKLENVVVKLKIGNIDLLVQKTLNNWRY